MLMALAVRGSRTGFGLPVHWARGLGTAPGLRAKRYSEKHEWVEAEGVGRVVRVGMTSYAAEALGDVVYAELPQSGSQVGMLIIAQNSPMACDEFLIKFL
jgi:glycine cleavage system H protein